MIMIATAGLIALILCLLFGIPYIDFMKKIWERSEHALFSDIFAKANIDLRVIEILDEDGELKSKEQIAIDVYHAVRNAINKSIERSGNPVIF